MDWDTYYMLIAKAVSLNSKCSSRQIGTILIKDKSIVSTGYNGPPRNVPPCSTRIGMYHDVHGDYAIIDGETTGIDWKHEFKDMCPRYVMGYRSGDGLDMCVAGHSERNAILQAAKMGIATKGCIMYCYCGPPCTPCLIEIVNAGIEEVVCLDLPFYDKMSEYIVKHSGLKIKRVPVNICEG